ncbi:MAG TPA: UPF0182 family protein [Nocardioidaceae bacterium]|nr:UPF0182 family protein [Nocardioidaceae bacterium]
MSGLFDEGRVFGQQPHPRAGGRQGPPRALIPTLVVVVLLLILGSTFTGLWTERLWFRSIDHSAVFSTLLSTRVLLFLVFGTLLAATVVANVAIAYRVRPVHRLLSPEQRSLDRYREVVEPIRRLVLLGLAAVMFFFGGSSAASQWETFLLWRNGESFGRRDATFNIDIGFFVFDYPFWRFLIGFGFAILIIGLIAAAVTHYLYGGISLQSPAEKVSGAAQVHLSVLLGLFMLLKAVAYWMDRYGLVIADGDLITGLTYTDDNAVLPAKNILMIIAVICAVLFFANVVRRTWMLPGLGLGLLVLSAVLLGGLWPFLVQQFQVNPSEPDREAPYIGRNIEATRQAYDVANVQVSPYNARTTLNAEQLRGDAEALPGTRLLDPTLVKQAFEQLQQVRGFYQVPNTLDVDRYEVNGEKRDMVLALREVNLNGLPPEQRNWNNDHTVYTHGFGVIAAYGNERTAEGEPVWAEQELPPRGVLGDYEPRIYFGELGPTYSVVGATEDGQPVELDIPDSAEGENQAQTNTYRGEGGVSVGGLFNKLLYAVKFREANIVLSSRVNENSKILYDRTPRERVEKVAPWLTADGNAYPAVVDDRIVWIVDGYTTSNSYPMSHRVSLGDATSDSLTQSSRSLAAQPQDDVNYMRNSVKAVVDAYDGSVTLYEWDENDPVLQAWSSAFPDTITDKEEIPQPMLDHFRYPEDLFKVQREILTEYHVTDPGDFYQGNNRWKVPDDPTAPRQSQPPYYLTLRMPDQNQPQFSLTSVFVPERREILASLMSVNAEASSPGYGTIRILQLPGNTQVQGPGQVQNAFNSDQAIARELLPFKQQEGARALFGNLLTLPVGNGLLYVQPVYTQRSQGAGNYPVLSYVLASFGDNVGYGSSLAEALDVVLGEESGVGEADNGPDGAGGGGGAGTGGNQPDGPTDQGVADLLNAAEQRFAEAEAALRNNDLAGYQRAIEQARRLVAQALQQQASPPPAGSSPAPQQGAQEGDQQGGGSDGATQAP